MPAIVRRTSTKVIDGRVSPKSRSDLSTINGYLIEKFPAGRGFRHVVSPTQLAAFIELIPDWGDHSHRLKRICLIGGSDDYFGYHARYRQVNSAMIALSAWSKKMWMPLSLGFFREHRDIFDALGVGYQLGLTAANCRFTVAQARAFTLLHVFMHELGHHRDWLRRRGVKLPGKEEYAETFARRHFDLLLPAYKTRFGDPSKKNEPEE